MSPVTLFLFWGYPLPSFAQLECWAAITLCHTYQLPTHCPLAAHWVPISGASLCTTKLLNYLWISHKTSLHCCPKRIKRHRQKAVSEPRQYKTVLVRKYLFLNFECHLKFCMKTKQNTYQLLEILLDFHQFAQIMSLTFFPSVFKLLKTKLEKYLLSQVICLKKLLFHFNRLLTSLLLCIS